MMLIKKRLVKGDGVRFSAQINGREIGRAYLYILFNDLHSKPFGLLEDVFVEEGFRGKGIGTSLTKAVIKEAKPLCYKLIATSRYSRPAVHKLYQGLGFMHWGKEFRMNF